MFCGESFFAWMCPGKRGCCVCDCEWYLTHGNGDYRLHWWKAQPSLRQTLTGPSNQNSSFWPWWINLQTCTHAQSFKPYWWTSHIFTNKLDKKPQEQPWKWLFYKRNQSTTWWKCVCGKHFERYVRMLSLRGFCNGESLSHTKEVALQRFWSKRILRAVTWWLTSMGPGDSQISHH